MNNGQKLGPRAKNHHPYMETRIVYGSTCTWWGKIQNTKVVDGFPVCPSCLGPLLEMANETIFWQAIGFFERGERGVKISHPGYTEFMKWLRHRCFKNIVVALTAYQTTTGVIIELDPSEYQAEIEESEGEE